MKNGRREEGWSFDTMHTGSLFSIRYARSRKNTRAFIISRNRIPAAARRNTEEYLGIAYGRFAMQFAGAITVT